MSFLLSGGLVGKSASVKLDSRQGEPTGEPMVQRETSKK